MKKYLWLLLFSILSACSAIQPRPAPFGPLTASSGTGFYIRPDCTTIISPVSGGSICWNTVIPQLQYWNGAAWTAANPGPTGPTGPPGATGGNGPAPPGVIPDFVGYSGTNTVEADALDAAGTDVTLARISAGHYKGIVLTINGITPGNTCINQFERSISSSAVGTCAPIGNADLATTLTPQFAGQGIGGAAPAGGLSVGAGELISSVGGTAPTVGSCGTGAAVRANANCTAASVPFACCTGVGTGTCPQSTNNSGQILIGSTNPTTSCILTWAIGTGITPTNPPVCAAPGDESTFQSLKPLTSTTTLTIIAATDMHGDLVDYVCNGKG